jgi:hypothetical protein
MKLPQSTYVKITWFDWTYDLPKCFFGRLVAQWHQFKQLLIRAKLHHEMKNHACPSMKRKCYWNAITWLMCSNRS